MVEHIVSESIPVPCWCSEGRYIYHIPVAVWEEHRPLAEAIQRLIADAAAEADRMLIGAPA